MLGRPGVAGTLLASIGSVRHAWGGHRTLAACMKPTSKTIERGYVALEGSFRQRVTPYFHRHEFFQSFQSRSVAFTIALAASRNQLGSRFARSRLMPPPLF